MVVMYRFLFTLVAVTLLTVPLYTEAATLYFSPTETTLYRGDAERLSVRLDVDADECVNVVDGVISYSDNIEVADLFIGSSIFSMWVEEPQINRESKTISFAGGIPNGYCGRVEGDPRLTNVLLDIIVQSPGVSIGMSGSGSSSGTTTDQATIAFTPETSVYLNDGLGSDAPLNTYDATVALMRTAGSESQNDWLDNVAADTQDPQPFTIRLEQTDNAFSGEYFVTFQSTDKQSGLSHYEVMEESNQSDSLFTWGRADAPWVETRSPYVLKDQTLNSTIYVKAIDKAGNEYVATLVPDEHLRTGLPVIPYVLMAILGGLVVVLSGVAWWIVRRKQANYAE